MEPRFTILAATCGAFFLVCADVQAQNPVTRSLQSLEERASHDINEAAEEMPEDKYGFRPTPEQLTFGEVILHVAETNTFLCSAIAGRAPPEKLQKLSPAYSKDKVVERLDDSFDFCNSVLEHADDSRLEDSVPFFGGRKTTQAAALIALAANWADHYGQIASYMRLNGLLPPTAKKKKS